ncbi:MAG TPA: hypothetical protein VIA62_10630 [Thermoanaerobaculia bacterium]|nr:hypothetical protein [Thermoanaerobaculia bacterium]
MHDEVEILGEVSDVETIASGSSVRQRRLLSRVYGAGNWRKLKGIATVRLPDGFVVLAEVHWFEAHGRGRQDVKIKRFLRQPP